MFVQTRLHKRFDTVYALDVSAKAAYDEIDYSSAWGNSHYGQSELQLHSVHQWRLTPAWSLSAGVGLQWDALFSELCAAERTEVDASVAALYRQEALQVNLAFNYGGYFDKENPQEGRKGKSEHHFRPSADLRWRMTEGLDLVAFFRRQQRTPTFNELYYAGYGNPALRSEDAVLSDMGLDFFRNLGDSWRLRAKVDGYFNYLWDKIASAPTPEDPYVWMPYNISRVRTLGTDLVLGGDFASGDWKAGAELRYSLQDAVDVSPGAQGAEPEYLPYIARHSADIKVYADWKALRLTLHWTGRDGRRDAAGAMPGWQQTDLSLDKTFSLGKGGDLNLMAGVYNLADRRYEIVSGYPVPGRCFTAGLTYRF